MLRAAAQLRHLIPQLEIRTVGSGPQYKRLRGICAGLHLDDTVHWLGDVPLSRLAAEYNRAHVFCLPSLQEGFGIVFLEAMAAGNQLLPFGPRLSRKWFNGILVEPESSEALADGRDASLCSSLASASCRDGEQFDVRRVARSFLLEIANVAPKKAGGSRRCKPIKNEISAKVFSQGR